jgi:glycosyltransferase involved in cell wall biosynthesis
MAAKIMHIPSIINTIPGLGYTFLRPGFNGKLLKQTISLLYRIALSGNQTRAIFQNPDDLEQFVSAGLVSKRNAYLIRGVGVSLKEYYPIPEPPGVPIVLFASRILWDKGVRELIEASRLLRQRKIRCRVIIAGIPDPANPESVPITAIRQWQDEGIVEWWGQRNDMPAVLQKASIVVLPSYREGMPRILMEAAAAGRPVVATNVPGCKSAVHNGDNGYLVPARDSVALAGAIEVLICNPCLRLKMGLRSREIAVSEFSEDRIIEQTIAILSESLNAG